MLPLKLTLLFSFILIAFTIPAEDIVHFPELNYTHNFYSGYLSFDTGSYHYVFFQSQKDPSNDPLNIWFNGGPGCSSLLGMFYENGPFVFQANQTILKINQFSWNKQSNLLYIQTPGGVGFSQSFRNNSYSDETATQDNLKALIKFYQKFPNLKKNNLFLTGQSYAGVYVPYLAKAIIDYNKLPNKQLTFNFKGFMVNNACTDPRQCYQPRIAHSNTIWQYQYWNNHGFITQKQLNDVQSACLMGYFSEPCTNARKNVDQFISLTNTSIYNIYQPCYYQISTVNNKVRQSGRLSILNQKVSCEDDLGITQFLNQLTVQSLFHVNKKYFTSCSSDVSSKYKLNPSQSYQLYKTLIKQKLNIWVVSGDHDADVPITGTLDWIKRLREEASLSITDPWREWWVKGLHKYEDQVAGMTWGLRGIRFASVMGAGHMVHQDKKQASYVLVNSFLKGLPLPNKQQVQV